METQSVFFKDAIKSFKTCSIMDLINLSNLISSDESLTINCRNEWVKAIDQLLIDKVNKGRKKAQVKLKDKELSISQLQSKYTKVSTLQIFIDAAMGSIPKNGILTVIRILKQRDAALQALAS